MRDVVEMIAKQHWLEAPNQGNSWDQTMPVNTISNSGGERTTLAIPFSTIFFRAIMEEVKTRTGIVAEKTYEKFTSQAMRDKKAQQKRDAVVAEASARPLEEAIDTRAKHLKRRETQEGQEDGEKEDENDPTGNGEAPQAAGDAGATTEPAGRHPKKRHRGASTGDGTHPSRGGHSSNAAAHHRGGSSNTATAPHHKTKDGSSAKRGGLHVTVMARGGRGNQTSSQAPHDHTPWRGRGRGERGRGQHWNTRGSSRGFRGGWSSN